jgi:hypothetical protein
MKDRSNLILAVAFLAIVAAIGGGSRADIAAQMPLRLLALGFLAVGLWKPNRVRMGRYRPLFWLLFLIALLPALQLVPLPYDLWAAIPGHGFYAAISERIGLAEVWRPLSLEPSMTWNALLSLLIPATMLVLGTQVAADRLPRFALAIVAIALVSLVLGHAQAAGGAGSQLRFYRITNNDAMVGIFANRNHHAVLLSMALPILCCLAASYRDNETWRRIGLPSCILAGLVVGSTLLFAGSRAGLLTGAVGALSGTILYASMMNVRPRHSERDRHRHRQARFAWLERLRTPWVAPGAMVVAIALAAIGFASTPAMQRLIHTSAAEEDRVQLFPPMVKLAEALLPFGGGFGSFNDVFRRFEPVDQLKTVYLNHAHMELVEIIVEGGVLAVVLLGAFLVWWGRRAIFAWRQPASSRFEGNLGRLGSITTGLALLASLVDYPLRTPIHAAIFVIGCIWMQRTGSDTPAREY